MTDFEDLTFLDPDAATTDGPDLASVKARGRRRRNRRRLAAGAPAVLALASVVAVAVIVPGTRSSTSGVVPAAPTASPSVTSNPTSAQASPSTSSPTSSPTSATPPVVAVVAATPVVREQLLQAYATWQGEDVRQYAGFAPGQLYDAHVLATGTDWALGTVQAAAGATAQTVASLQAGDDQAVFHRAGSSSWQVTLVGPHGICPGLLPNAVLGAWDLPVTSAACNGHPVALALQVGGGPGSRPSQEYVTASGTRLSPQATNGDIVVLTVSTAAERFVATAGDYALTAVHADGTTTTSPCTAESGAPESTIVPPLSTGGVSLACPAVYGADRASFRFLYAPGGTTLGSWSGR